VVGAATASGASTAGARTFPAAATRADPDPMMIAMTATSESPLRLRAAARPHQCSMGPLPQGRALIVLRSGGGGRDFAGLFRIAPAACDTLWPVCAASSRRADGRCEPG